MALDKLLRAVGLDLFSYLKAHDALARCAVMNEGMRLSAIAKAVRFLMVDPMQSVPGM
jgi:hypothetical protein